MPLRQLIVYSNKISQRFTYEGIGAAGRLESWHPVETGRETCHYAALAPRFGVVRILGLDCWCPPLFPLWISKCSGRERKKLHSRRRTKREDCYYDGRWNRRRTYEREREREKEERRLSLIRAAVNLRGCGSSRMGEKSRGKNNDFRYGAAKVFGTPVTSCPSSKGTAAFSHLFLTWPTMAPLVDQRVLPKCKFLSYVIYFRATWLVNWW